MGFLTGKKLLITGVLSNRSIAYGIAKACHREGAELAFSYVGERFKDRITEYAAEFGSKLVFDCDVGSDEQIDRLFKDLGQHWPQFDGFVHAIGFAPREAIAGDFLEGISREAFRIAHDISAYSFPAMAKAAAPMLRDKVIRASVRLAESDHVQVQLAEAAARLDAAQLLFDTRRDWAIGLVDSGAVIGEKERLLARRDVVFAERQVRQAVESLCELAGTATVYDSHGLQAVLRDVLTISTHGVANWQLAMAPYGRMMLLG